ncbi:hypothetical protein EYC84_004591 [Monilinia fructicola]|uniref:FAD-binding FR-type domain-containing protein n=1 Tax=Monilinia fructicola TaxID=38448 RepID=A0A5M9K5J1_MONFR|nr:hypothetical protein EYC84_004591 [Monilinia fructicola]
MGFLQALSGQLRGTKLLFNFLFHGFHIGLFAFGWWKQANDPRLSGLNTLTFSVWISRGAGLVLTVDVALILLPMCRNILRYVRPKIKFLPLDESQWFHRQVAYSLLLWTIFHVAAHYVNFFNVEKTQIRPVTAIQIHYTEAGGITGHIMLLCMMLIYTTAHAKIRQTIFRDILVNGSSSMFLPFPVVNGIRSPLHHVHLTLTFPFTSAKSETFTRTLGDALGAGAAQAKLYDSVDPRGMYEVALDNGQKMPDIRIDGPYGAPAEDVFENEVAVLIGTGIGVTPWASILKNIWHLRHGTNPPERLRRVEFIWVCKDTNSFEWFHTLLASLEAQSHEAATQPGNDGQEFLRIHTYLNAKARHRHGAKHRAQQLYFCGPNVAARSIKKACKIATTNDVNFSFWKEHF